DISTLIIPIRECKRKYVLLIVFFIKKGTEYAYSVQITNLKGGQLVYNYIITVFVYYEVTKKLKYINFYACFCSVAKFSRYLIACSAAILPSPVAVTTCRNSFSRISPAANIPGILVSIFSFVVIYPSSFRIFNDLNGSFKGTMPIYTNTPSVSNSLVAPVFTFLSDRFPTFPSTSLIDSTTVSQMNSILSLSKARF